MWWPWRNGRDIQRDELNALSVHLAQGNSLAKIAVELIANSATEVDPTFGSPVICGVKILRLLQQLNVRGHRLWDFYCFVAREDLRHFVLILRAYQLGLVTGDQINAAIDDDQRPLDMSRIIRAVEELVPALKRERREKKKERGNLFKIDWTARRGR